MNPNAQNPNTYLPAGQDPDAAWAAGAKVARAGGDIGCNPWRELHSTAFYPRGTPRADALQCFQAWRDGWLAARGCMDGTACTSTEDVMLPPKYEPEDDHSAYPD